MIESVEKTEALIEIALCFGRFSRDLARIGAEAVVKWFLRCNQVPAGQCQRRPDRDVEGFGGHFHKRSCRTIRQRMAATANIAD